jgi:Spy/CpxP family protein refolding chaperone
MNVFKIILILLIAFISNLSFSQNINDKKQMRNGIDSIMKQKVMDNLGLDESSADKFINAFKGNSKQIRLFNKEKKELMQSIEDNPSAADVDTKLDRMLELETKIVEQRKAFFNELKGFLTPQQIARTIVLRKKFERQFKKEILKHKRQNRMNNDSNDTDKDEDDK